MSPLALVTGATGTVGPSLVDGLLSSGHDVRTYSLDSLPENLFSGPVHQLQGDINDPAALAKALKEVDVVFHLAALLHIENPSPELAPQYHRVNVDGARSVAEQAAQAGVRRLVYFSTVKVYGIQQRAPVPEDYPTRPSSLYAKTKLVGEEAVRAVEGIETCVLRLSAIYGPHLKGSWNHLVKAIERGRFVPIGNLENMHSLTFVDDVAQAALLAAQHPDASNQIYNVVGFQAPTLREILNAIYTALGQRMPSFTVPSAVALSGAYFLDRGFKLLSRCPPLTPEAVRQLIDHEVYSGRKLRQLGLDIKSTLEQSWQQTIDQRKV